MMKTVMGMFVGFCVSMLVGVTGAQSETIGSVNMKANFFGLAGYDKAIITVFDDPDYPEVSCYVTTVERNWDWENATDSSLACRLIAEKADSSKNYQDRPSVFSESAGPWFKTHQVDRFYDKKRKVLVYISYVKKQEGKNFSHSISVVPLFLK